MFPPIPSQLSDSPPPSPRAIHPEEFIMSRVWERVHHTHKRRGKPHARHRETKQNKTKQGITMVNPGTMIHHICYCLLQLSRASCPKLPLCTENIIQVINLPLTLCDWETNHRCDPFKTIKLIQSCRCIIISHIFPSKPRVNSNTHKQMGCIFFHDKLPDRYQRVIPKTKAQ